MDTVDHLHKAAFNAMRVSTALRFPLLGPFVTRNIDRIVSLPEPHIDHILSLYNASRIWKFFPSMCFRTPRALDICTPSNSIFACGSSCNISASAFQPLLKWDKHAWKSVSKVKLPSSDARLARVAYRNNRLSSAKCLFVSSYAIGGRAETSASLDFFTTRRPTIDKVFLKSTNVAAAALLKARAQFRAALWKMWPELNKPTAPRNVDVVVGYDGWLREGKCGVQKRSLALHRALSSLDIRRVVVIEGGLFHRNVSEYLRGDGGSKGRVEYVKVRKMPMLQESLLARRYMSLAKKCVQLDRGEGLVNAYRLEKERSLCTRLRFLEENCTYIYE